MINILFQYCEFFFKNLFLRKVIYALDIIKIEGVKNYDTKWFKTGECFGNLINVKYTHSPLVYALA